MNTQKQLPIFIIFFILLSLVQPKTEKIILANHASLRNDLKAKI